MITKQNVDAALVSANVKSKEKRDIFISILSNLEILGINNNKRLAVFIGQLSHESDGFSRLEENLNYSANRLRQVWPSRFINDATAKKYARNPIALANKVYNGRMGNRVDSNDGWDYRGRGALQITGSDNYKSLGYYDNPDELKSLAVSLEVAAQWFSDNDITDRQTERQYRISDRLDHKAITRKINGGYHGLKSRKKLTMKALSALENGVIKVFNLLKLGSRGEKVKEIQRALGIKDDGVFGKGTKCSVMVFQQANGLHVDGVVGEKTFSIMIK